MSAEPAPATDSPSTSGPLPRSAIYTGMVRHRRFVPHEHAFEYRIYMSYLDLDEVESVLDGPFLPWGWATSSKRPAPMRFSREDYFGDPTIGLRETVCREVERQSGVRPRGPIRLLTHLRTWGLAFNPVSFYYCFDAEGKSVEHVVAEITNTPWDERHCYVLSAPQEHRSGVATHHLRKEFHVSPFFDMDMDYRWKFSEPGERLLVHLENLETGSRSSKDKLFDATLSLERQGPLGARSLLLAQLRYPAVTAMVLYRIYRQALALWMKKTPFYTHPSKRAEAPVTEGTLVEAGHGDRPI